MKQEKFNITPETKIAALLDAYPDMEEILIEMAPEFKKLRNPVLRKTIAKIASLRQVAEVGKISLSDLINKLRAEAGIKDEVDFENEDTNNSSVKPAWFDETKIVNSLDARELIERGEHPMGRVLVELKEINSGNIYELITPFLPAPLLDKVKAQGFNVWSNEKHPDMVKSYFYKS